MKTFFKKLILNIVAAIGLLAGVFLTIAGPLSGLGNDALIARLGWCLVGLMLAGIGLMAIYRANDRSWSKVIDSMLNIILLNWR